MSARLSWLPVAGLFLAALSSWTGCDGGGEDSCQGVSCSDHGQCGLVDGRAVCLCEAGYQAEGLTCLETVSPCNPDPCLHGACAVDGAGFTCACEAGYAGERCDGCAQGYHAEGLRCLPDVVDACAPNPCPAAWHRGRCVPDGAGGYSCLCDPGYHEDGGTCAEDTSCDPATTCSGHGLCTGVGLGCGCDAGYAGLHCEGCAQGYHPEAGACVEDSVCDPATTCAGHGTCTGVGLACACDTGYTGAGCAACAAGYHVEAGACVADTVCDPATTCTGHGTCTGVGLACACDTGYTGAHCEDCAAGYQDEDGDRVCRPDCATAALDCGLHGHCAVQSGQARCACDDGYQDRDGDGACQPTCATAGLTCASGEVCSDASGEARCVSAVKPPIYISFHWHMHQPIYYPYESIVATEASNHMGFSVYQVHFDRTGPYTTWPRDAVSSGAALPHLGAQVSLSGSLMENLNNLAAAGAGFQGWTAGWTEAAGWDTALGNPRLDLVNFGYHHPLMGLIDPLDTRLQIQAHQAMVDRHLGGRRSKGIFPPECAFSPRMIPALAAEGIEWTLVDNVHFDRSHLDYPWVPESNLPRPNPADQVNAQATDWVALNGLWAPSRVAAPWGYQPHYVEYVDPVSGQASRLIAVPAARYEGNEDGRGGFGALNYETVMSQYEALNTDPLHPMLIVLHHDGDNYGGGTESYYHGNFQAFVSWAAGQPTRFVPTTVQDYLDQFPPDADDVIHVEDGSWSGADNGDPEFHKWNGDPGADGYSPDRNSWAVITAVKNRVLTAEAIQPHTSAAAIVDGTGNDTDHAWHHLLNAETSCYWYWDNSAGGLWDSHPTRGANLAVGYADAVLAQGADTLGPTIYLPQREPYNPGLAPEPSDFEVWTFVYDVSGLQQVELRWRVDADGVRDGANEVYAGGAWQAAEMDGATLAPRTDPLPLYQAAQYQAEIADLRDALVDYYVSATDSLGHEARSPLMHVWVGDAAGQPGDIWSPSEPTAADVITFTWNRAGFLHWGVDGSLNGHWLAPPAEYWPAGSTLWADGRAIESPLAGPDAEGNYTLQLGPFDGTPVEEVNFVFHHADGTWSSPDHTIPIAP
jgi:hypothetical protein